ncbi:2-dehydro-3-deoxyphosphogluconate aldolase [Sphingomonas melonis TY]|jgi:2-dehydro-3-deoxyphosphogluconate aldolase / (4S)-4-hydroxy-2-oxoglutarate aldolase|uniref:2-dehydro-3-deoxy-phosphogluconate aldolase n=2 Tax=Sphingomonas TaxID=13687 RepID=A0A154NDH5_9SPHN|nr:MULTISPECIES: bifunctional 4-hydroxy-2-oxoglutarate aldolase/2-dehydro-3-deoxy-phosphogluconate aldolase [Sphingomonas]AOW23772.1 2-dehydro-3-deoxyphosphogluconate aldolase [Sphingomonas melonis TY]ATI54779.1 2-dehydro-3-deoxyphosphogluconate aldolase [Sphingomonas melonis]KZB96839.1 2-dehydro-3-deoxyphosphogluconate aldolase [Sphingomonas melonis TY]MBB3875969.1 2-dehydro-3-deoxyphosphogluconate aldolase/(4S)-4-hydroxy-2-oxoglutarate aldolase [Sphingomonas aquatilis]MBI0531255.1 bifunction
MTDIATIMQTSAVIPVLVIDDAATAKPLAQALVAGGLRVLEVTLRTPAAMEAIAEMKTVPGAIVGAGTVVNEAQAKAVIDAGVEFIVSPGLTERLARPILDAGVAYLPGTATAGDIMRGLDLGLTHFKFFPAETSGGLKALKALAAPFYQCRFCPTGGITEASAPDWLAFDPVLCVGGSWVTGGSMADVEAKARAASALRR